MLMGDQETCERVLKFQYGDQQITFERVDKKGAAHKVLIKVHPDCRVVVAAPGSADDSDVVAAVKKRSRWISKQLQEFQEQLGHVLPRKYTSGESHLYLGRRHVLKLSIKPESAPHVKLLRGRFDVVARTRASDYLRALMMRWYSERARVVFAQRINSAMDEALWVSETPGFRLKRMHKQWGSCSPRGMLTLNPHLVKAPTECIDYVILHEFCHLEEHNHSARFYSLLDRVMPDWERRKLRLDSLAAMLLNS